MANVVIPDLLDRASNGVTPVISGEIRNVLADLDGSPVVLCTCSTLGGSAERIGAELGVRVVRIDRPMAENAVEVGGKVGLVAAAPSTLKPTRDLLEEVAVDAGSHIDIEEVVIESAWALNQTGDVVGYLTECERVVRNRAPEFDVVVLAQGSMAEVASRCSDLATPILASPRSGVERILKLAGQ
ncbi:MAG: hypothetical protein WA988_04515 [Candidatus Nanopelagicales bacterium]